MLGPKEIKAWYLVHRWTSLICTAFLLMLCITGLPLVFYEEIEHLTGRHPEPAALPAGTPSASLDRILGAAQALRPNAVVQYVSFDEHEPLIGVTTGVSATAQDVTFDTFDARTAQKIEAPPFDEGFMWVMFKLHFDMYAGLPGTLFLGLMGLLFVASIVSGVVVYAPFMRKLDFGTVRTGRSQRLKWLDLHNVLGIVTLAWVLVVGLTGVINTLSTPIRMMWQTGQLAEMTAPYKDLPPPARFASLQAAVSTAQAAAPDMKPSFIAFPGTELSSQHHYAVFMQGGTPLTSKLYTPALIDAETGSLTDMRAMPWYVSALFLSQPLHFGDYGGMPLKILWALLDLVAIAVLGSGLYLWLGRRRSSLEARLTELEQGGASALAPALRDASS